MSESAVGAHFWPRGAREVGVDEVVEAARQDGGGDAEIGLDLVESRHAADQDVAEDEWCLPLADEFERLGSGESMCPKLLCFMSSNVVLGRLASQQPLHHRSKPGGDETGECRDRRQIEEGPVEGGERTCLR